MVGFLPDHQATPASLVSDQSPLLAEEDVTIVLAEGWVGLPLELRVGGPSLDLGGWVGPPLYQITPGIGSGKQGGNFCVRFNLQSRNIP